VHLGECALDGLHYSLKCDLVQNQYYYSPALLEFAHFIAGDR
jgi:hypothetical protein